RLEHRCACGFFQDSSWLRLEYREPGDRGFRLIRSSMLRAWIAFLAAATFFAIVVPLGEGFDELAHFAYIQHIAQAGRLPLEVTAYPSKEIEAFLQYHPAPWSLHSINPALTSHD